MTQQPSGPPPSLLALAESVSARLAAAAVPFSIRYIEPSDVSSWRLAVDAEEGSVDLMFGTHDSNDIAVVFDYQEEVSVEVATEFVAMSLDLISEDVWLALFDEEVQARRTAEGQARRKKRRERRDAWLTRLGLRR
jgi:hypothetical protein